MKIERTVNISRLSRANFYAHHCDVTRMSAVFAIEIAALSIVFFGHDACTEIAISEMLQCPLVHNRCTIFKNRIAMYGHPIWR